MPAKLHLPALQCSAIFLLLILSSCGGSSGSEAVSASEVAPLNLAEEYPGRTTLDQTLERGGTGLFKDIIPGTCKNSVPGACGEARTLRRLFPGGAAPSSVVPMLAFAQLTDLHIVDDKSPMRMEFLDRLADNNDGGVDDSPYDSAYRPQEMLSTQLADAMCRAIRKVGPAPATGLPLQFTLVTGDGIDNAQWNETRNYIDLLDGAMVHPRSGSTVEQSAGGWGGTDDDHYYAPAADSSSAAGNWYLQKGFPRVPSLFPDCRQPFQATGLGMPWFASIGNHDVKVQGNVPIDYLDHWFNPDITLGQRATGDRKILAMDGMDRLSGGTWDGISLLLDLAFNNNVSRGVAADPDRRLRSKREFIAEHFSTSGQPVGHGFTQGSDVGDYVMPAIPGSPLRFISLDTTLAGEVNAAGVTEEQFSWLEATLKSFSSRYRLRGGQVFLPNPGVEDKLIVVYCHDSLASLGMGVGQWGLRLESLLLEFPNVIMLVDGHTHANAITPHFLDLLDRPEFPQGAHYNRNGFWEVTTASPIDWPVQSRLIELNFGAGTPGDGSDNEGIGYGTLSIFTTMLDADAPLSFGGDTSSPARLAALGRQLAANDPNEVGRGIDRRRGAPESRNAQLLLPAPFPVYPVVSGVTAAGHIRAVTVSWPAATGAWSYTLKRSLSPSGPFTVVEDGLFGTSRTDIHCDPARTYFYVVAAANGYGEGPDSAPVVALTVPDGVANLSGTAGYERAILTWSATPGATSYTVKESTDGGRTFFDAAAGVTDTSFVVTGLTNGAAYLFKVAAANTSGEGYAFWEVLVIPYLPLPGSATVSYTTTHGQVSLSWTAAGGATSYNVERSYLCSGQYNTLIRGVTGLGYVDAGLADGNRYCYMVTSVNEYGSNPVSNHVDVIVGQTCPSGWHDCGGGCCGQDGESCLAWCE